MTTNGATELRPTVCELATATLPDEILVCPWGSVESSSGDFVLDDEAAKAIIEAFNAHAVDLPVDFEHQTLGGKFTSPDGRAPAAGWIKALRVQPGVGLFAKVSWTPQAAGDLADRKYRYLSPVLMVRKGDGRALELHSVALTNKPAIAGMTPVVNKDGTANQGGTMDKYEKLLSELRALAGLDASADEQTILATLRESLGATSTANSAGGVDLTRFIALADHRAVCKRATDAEQALFAMKVDIFIDEGQRRGKISTATRDIWVRAFSANPKQARADLANSPVIFPPDGRVIHRGSHDSLGGRTNPDRRAVINVSRIEYDCEPGLRKVVSKADYISGELRQAGLAPLSKDEAAALAGQC